MKQEIMKQLQNQIKQKEEELQANEKEGIILKEELQNLQNAAPHFTLLLAKKELKGKEKIKTEAASSSSTTTKQESSTTTNHKKWYEIVEDEDEQEALSSKKNIQKNVRNL